MIKTGYELMQTIKARCKDDNELKMCMKQKENEGKAKNLALIKKRPFRSIFVVE